MSATSTSRQLALFDEVTSSLKEWQRPASRPNVAAPPAHVPPSRTATIGSANRAEDRRAQVITHQWEGTVQSVSGDSFAAVLRSLSEQPGTSEKVADIPVEDVSADDRELLSEGAVFYWTVGQSVSLRGTMERFSSIRFRRLPLWSRKDLKQVADDGAELYNMFGDPGAEGQASSR